MGTEAIDRVHSRAVLIGVSAYEDAALPNVPAAANSLQAMHAALTDRDIGGWPADRVTVIAEPHEPVRLAQQLRRLAEETHDVFLVYFVGHGTITARGELCLALSGTEMTDPDLTGLEYLKVKSAFSRCPARIQIAILDCCYSGRAIETLAGTALELADNTDVRGVYTLTASDHTAHVVPLAEQITACTSFTGELVDILQTGLPSPVKHLTFQDLYPVLRHRLTTQNLPAPNQRGTDTAGGFVIARNRAAIRWRTREEMRYPQSGNEVVLNPAIPFNERINRVVDIWLSGGRTSDGLINGKAFFLAYCWFIKHRDPASFEKIKDSGESRSGFADSPDLAQYMAASLASIGGDWGWNELLRERTVCPLCNDTYRAENISICIGCTSYICPRCAFEYHRGDDCEIVG